MTQLHHEDTDRVLRYIQKEPEMNLFFLGDIENHGVDVHPVSVYASEKPDGTWDALLLRYFDFWLVYSQSEAYDAKAVANFLDGKAHDCISGKTELLEKLQPFMPTLNVQSDYLCRLDKVNEDAVLPLPTGAVLRELTKDDITQYLDLMSSCAEFSKNFQGEDMLDKRRREMEIKLQTGDTTVGLFENGRMVATAGLSASNSQSAMVVGVGTRTEYRRKGCATAAVGYICRLSLERGKQYLCLFYDNPNAGRIYRRLGFREIGGYAMMR